jgi:hypothetical protein
MATVSRFMQIDNALSEADYFRNVAIAQEILSRRTPTDRDAH